MTAPQATPASATRGRFALRRLGSAVAAVAAVAVVAISVAASAGAAAGFALGLAAITTMKSPSPMLSGARKREQASERQVGERWRSATGTRYARRRGGKLAGCCSQEARSLSLSSTLPWKMSFMPSASQPALVPYSLAAATSLTLPTIMSGVTSWS